MDKSINNREELKEKLTPEAYRVTQEREIEAPYSGKYLNNKEAGVYRCVVCGAELFSSDTKFDSGTGWPSFTEPANLENVSLKDDFSHGMERTEVICKNCSAHLGHVFPDGPEVLPDGRQASGKRYCINSCSLNFESKEK